MLEEILRPVALLSILASQFAFVFVVWRLLRLLDGRAQDIKLWRFDDGTTYSLVAREADASGIRLTETERRFMALLIDDLSATADRRDLVISILKEMRHQDVPARGPNRVLKAMSAVRGLTGPPPEYCPTCGGRW